MKPNLCCLVNPVYSCPYCNWKLCNQHLIDDSYRVYLHHQKMSRSCPNRGRFLKEKFALKQNKRKIYIVTRDYFSAPSGVLNVPNLGVHTSLLRAKDHFESVLKDRKVAMQGKVQWDVSDNVTYNNYPDVVLRRVRIEYSNGQAEELKLEQWGV